MQRPLICAVLALALYCSVPDRAHAIDQCDNSSQTTSGSGTSYFVYRPLPLGSLQRRDLELLWSMNYPYAENDPSVRGTLDKLAENICSTIGTNAFGAPLSNINLVYDYFRRQKTPGFPGDGAYSLNPQDSTSLRVGNDRQAGIDLYNPRDRSHVDIYLGAPSDGVPATYLPDFVDGKEDLSTGHSTADAKHGNSISFSGPYPSRLVDLAGSGWTHPDSGHVSGLLHEFQHSLPGYSGDATPPTFDEIMSSGAESILGYSTVPPIYEVPYTWPLTARSNETFNCAADPPWKSTRNYQAWEAFTAYLAYNFRGADTSATIAGLNDDLLHRWARSPARNFVDLAGLMVNDSCFNCPALLGDWPNHLRLQILLHNWRVANFVNQPALANGQYGYPAFNHFSPGNTLQAWRAFDPCPKNDLVAVPPVITVGPMQVHRETTLVGTRSRGGFSHPLAMGLFGSEYFVLRSDPALHVTAQDLVVTVSLDSMYLSHVFSVAPRSRRVFASAVAYVAQDTGVVQSRLWEHPEWAQLALSPVWMDTDSARGVTQLVIPGFGTTYKAALVVLSLGSPEGSYPSGTFDEYRAEQPFRLGLVLRRAPFQSINPLPLTGHLLLHDDHPSWSPAGDEVVYTRLVTGAASQIYRLRLDGTPSSLLSPMPGLNQIRPDWSPRGDWVVYEQEGVGADKETSIWAFNTTNASLRRLTPQDPNAAQCPAFSPNGQQVAYVRLGNQISSIRRVDISGANDVLLASIPLVGNLTSLRWSPDGRFIYFARNDSLFAVDGINGSTPVARSPSTRVFPTSFDLGPGPKGMVAERSQALKPISALSVPPHAPLPYHPITLRDTTRNDTVDVFFRAGYRYRSPRFSPEGTRLAYVSEVEGQSSPDLFVGQFSYDHAPVFNNLTDATVQEGNTLNIYLFATDADGETITYQDVLRYRPPGATLDGQGHFRWQNAGPPGEYHVVFRAFDGSGGYANRVVKITVDPDQGQSGCPFLDTRTAAGWEIENSLLARSAEGTLSTDTYRLKNVPELADGRYRLRLRENAQEITTLDEVRLAIVDHAPEVRAWPLKDRVVLGARIPAYRVTNAAGKDITGQVDGRSGGYRAEAGDVLNVDLVPPDSLVPIVAPDLDPFEIDDGGKDGGGGGGGGGGGLRAGPQVSGDVDYDAQLLASTGILIQGPDQGGWKTFRHRHPRARFDEVVYDTLDRGPLRLQFLDRHDLRFIGRVIPTTVPLQPRVLPLLAARHSKLGDVRSSLADSGSAPTELAPGDTIELEFAAPPTERGLARDFFLFSRGVYTSLRSRQLRQTPSAVPVRFALRQNRPNPFGESSVIGFDVPASTRVGLTVFDAQGRNVRVLTDRTYAPGRWTVEWDGLDSGRNPVPPGIYYYRMRTPAFTATRKMILLP